MPLTIFDLDETLIAADSDYEWGQFVVDKGLVDAEKHAKKNNLNITYLNTVPESLKLQNKFDIILNFPYKTLKE